MERISIEQTKDMLVAVCNVIIESKPYLTEVDSKIGDGDHGIGMAGGMEKAKEALLGQNGFTSVNEVFKTMGMAMLNSMGGASGVIFGTMFLGGIKGKEAMEELSCTGFWLLMKDALEAVQKRGGAKPGDKTMVDALAPAVEAMERTAGLGLLPMLKAAEEAARQGVEDTKNYQAKFGRAKSLMERAVGYQDAGATSVWLIFRGMREFVEGGCEI